IDLVMKRYDIGDSYCFGCSSGFLRRGECIHPRGRLRRPMLQALIQLMRERATSLDAILPVLRDCERARSTSGRIWANYKSREARSQNRFGALVVESTADNSRDYREDWQPQRCEIFTMTGKLPNRKHDVHGQNHNLSRLQVKAAGANSKKPTAAGTVCDDGFPGSFSGTYSANQA